MYVNILMFQVHCSNMHWNSDYLDPAHSSNNQGYPCGHIKKYQPGRHNATSRYVC